MKKTFKCDCGTHLITVEHDKKYKYVWIGIDDIYSPETGRKYKHPKLIGDVILLDKELIKFVNFIKKLGV